MVNGKTPNCDKKDLITYNFREIRTKLETAHKASKILRAPSQAFDENLAESIECAPVATDGRLQAANSIRAAAGAYCYGPQTPYNSSFLVGDTTSSTQPELVAILMALKSARGLGLKRLLGWRIRYQLLPWPPRQFSHKSTPA